MATEFQSAKVIVSIETIVKNLERDSKRLEGLRKTLQSIASIKLGTNRAGSQPSFDKAAVSAQKLVLQQQKLITQTQELANRQERARQAADRLAISQKKVADTAAKFKQSAGRQADAHVKDFRTAEKAAERLRVTQERLARQAAVSLQRQRSSAITGQQKAQERAVESLQRQRSAALIANFKAQEKAARDAATKRAQEAKKAADAEIREAKRAAQKVTENQRALLAGIRSFGQGLQSIGRSLTIALTAPLAAFGTIAARSARDIDAIRNRLIATEGSIEAANARLGRLRTLADESVGVTRRSANEAFAILSVVGDVTEKTIEQQIKALGRLNAAFTIEDQGTFFRNLIQIFQQGFERADIKEALTRVPIFEQLLESAFGTRDAAKLRALKESGKLTLDSFLAGLAGGVEKNPILQNIDESIGVRFAKTFERITDALEPLGRAILQPLERLVNIVEPLILRLANGFAALDPNMQTAIVGFGLLVAAAGPMLIVLGGLVSAFGGVITAVSAVGAVIATIGFPALLAVIGGLVIVIGEWVAILTVLGKAWQSNFLGIRDLVKNAANAVVAAFNRIREVFNEATQRILPTLQSLTTKVVNTVTAVWGQYGKTVVKTVGDAFRFVVDVAEIFIRTFTNFVDLVLKLIDGDWRGAWRAFARIVVAGIDQLIPLIARLERTVRRALATLVAFIVRQAVAFANAGTTLASRLIVALATGLIAGAPRIQNALTTMLLLAASGVALGPIAQAMVARLLAELRKAAAEGLPVTLQPTVGADVGFGGGLARKGRPTSPAASATKEDKKGERAIDREAKKLREAQDKLAEQNEKNRIAGVKAGVEQQFDLTKDGLNRELQALEENFEDRLTQVKQYFLERQRLQEAQIDAELKKEQGLSNVIGDEFAARRKLIEKEFQSAVQTINEDDRLKGRARELALQTAEINKQTAETEALADFESGLVQTSTNILKLQKDREEVARRTKRLTEEISREIERQKDQLQFDLFEARGATADAEAGRLKARFTETIRELRIDTTGLAADLQGALSRVDLSVLKKRLDALPEPVRVLLELLQIGIARAQIAERALDVDRSLAELRLQENEIQNKVLDGVFTEREARAQILALQDAARGRLLDILAAQRAIADATPGQEDEVLRIQAQIQEIERLGKTIDEVGQQINKALFDDVADGIEGIFQNARRGFDGLKDALISFGESILSTLNRIAAQSVTQKLEGIFKPDAENTQGTIGGFFSKLFGLAPKAADTSAATATATALTTAGTATATALTTGGTAAATALTSGGASAATTLLSGITGAATAFAATVSAAGAAFAAAVAAGAGAQSVGGLGSALGGAGAATGLFPAVPGGMYRIVEGGYPEAVITTDPKHATRQVGILRELIARTKGFYGRIQVPDLAIGGFVSRDTAEANLLNSINRAPAFSPQMPAGALANDGSKQARGLRIILVKDMREVRDYINSAEGEQVIVERLGRNSTFKTMVRG